MRTAKTVRVKAATDRPYASMLRAFLRRWLACRWVGLLLLGATSLPGYAGTQPTSDPLLRIETGMHTTFIRRVIADPARNRLITCSDDKTIRVWQMPEGRLISVLRVPIDVGHEGQLFALAVSPDGKTVASGGWTGWDWDQQGSIYLHDIESGKLIQRFGGLENAISALAWSRDGEHLVVGLQRPSGLRVLRISDGLTVASDPAYKDKILDMDVAANGRIAVISLDGFTRLYSEDFKLIGRRVIEGGKLASAVRFSPDAKHLGIAFVDAPRIAVASASKLAYEFSPDLAGVTDQKAFTAITWSSDGKFLYAGGESTAKGPNPVYRWADGGRGPRERIPVSQNRLNELRAMPGGRIAYAAEDPGFGILEPDNRISSFRTPDIHDFSRQHGKLQVSADGSVIRYPVGNASDGFHQFSLFAEGGQSLQSPAQATTHAPLLESENIRIGHWQNSFSPQINGRAPLLDDYEIIRAYAFDAGGNRLLLGTEWALRLLDEQANEIWQVKLPAVAWSVIIPEQGRFAIAALSDGSIRWYRLDDGSEVIALFPHRNGKDWIAWIPDGYYMSSVYGDNFVGWHLNRGKDLTPDFYRAVQFERILYRPDVVREAFKRQATAKTRGLAQANTGPDFKIGRLREIAPPRLQVRVLDIDTNEPGQPSMTLEIGAQKNAMPIENYTVYINKIPITRAAERQLEGSEQSRFTRVIKTRVPALQNEIRVEAFNGVSMGVSERYLALPGDTPVAPVEGDLYLLAIGINEFPDLPRSMHLAYAARDAEQMVATFERNRGKHFRNVHTHLLSDQSGDTPNAEQILGALDFAQSAGPNDTVIIFLASHGLSDKAGNYYFAPRDVRMGDVVNVMRGKPAPSMLSWNAFFETLRSAAGRRLLIVDTCHAQDIEGRFEAHSLMKRSAGALFPMLVAAKGSEESQEYAEKRHGLFTYAVLKAMHRDADQNHNGLVSLSEVFATASPIVAKLHDKTAGPQTPQLVAPAPLGNMPLLAIEPSASMR